MEPLADAPVPVRLVVSDDLARRRLTVAFRLLLAIPHLLWVSLWGAAATLASIVMWLAILFEGRAPRTLHGFVASFVRYSTHVSAYVFLAAGPFPGFTGGERYPVDVEIAGPVRQNRWSAGFRLLLAVPTVLLAAVLGGGPVGAVGGGAYVTGGGVLVAVSFLGWFAALVRARMPRGLRDLAAYAIAYGAQASAYVLLLTERYPDSGPATVTPPPELPPHPIRLSLDDELRRSRLMVAFRLLLVFPHVVWLMLWSLLAVLAAVAGWLAALVLGRLPRPLHRFLAAYVRYSSHLTAFVTLVGGRFPGFAGTAGSYPVGIEVDGPVRQGRWSVLFRLVLAVPAGIVASALQSVLFVVAVLGWFAALAVGRMPRGMRDLGAASVRYQAQTYAYLALVTPAYPYACPALEGSPAPCDDPSRGELPEPAPPGA